MKKKTVLTAVLTSALLFSTLAVTMLMQLGKANPIMNYWVNKGDVAPDENTEPPAILVLSPVNNTAYGVHAISLSLNVSIGNSSTATSRVLDEIYCETDWYQNNVSIYKYIWDPTPWTAPPRITEFSETINLTGIPEGDHMIKVYAVESGEYPLYVIQGENGDSRNIAHYYNGFNITGCSLVRFTIDTTSPKVSILSLENKTYYSSDIKLDFTINERSSLIAYCLDGKENETTGNTTLTGIPYGEHNVTIYATDMAGHIGASETIYFTIVEPFSTTMVIAAVVVLGVFGFGLIINLTRRKRGQE